jgi:hypothetical protein
MEGSTLRCTRCGKAAGKTRWTALAYGRCASNAAGALWSWTREHHQVVESGGTVTCSRCGGAVPAHRRGTFEGRTCPAWKAAPSAHGAGVPNGSEDTDWGAWVLRLLGHRAAGARQQSVGSCTIRPGTVEQSQNASAPACLNSQPIFAGTAWRPHVAAQGPRFAACLFCGDTAKDWLALGATPCNGWRGTLPVRVTALVTLGDVLIRAGGPPVGFSAALAARRGERPRPPE